MSEPIYKVYKAEIKNIDTENYIVDAVVTTQTPDRDKEIVSVQGFEKGLQEYKKHPVLLSCHEWRDLRKNIGQAEDFHFNNTSAEIKFRYFVGKGNEEADWAFQLAQEGIAAYSIGFIPMDWRKPDDAEKIEGIERVHTKFEVLEISQVLIPSNRDALQVRQKMARIEEELCSQALQNSNIEQISGLIVSKPYENEHACRLRDPNDFQDDSFRRTTRKHDGKEYSVIMGKLKGEDTMTEQAYRYKKDIWTISSAQAHCKDHKGKFEAAKYVTIDLMDEQGEQNVGATEKHKSMPGIFEIEGFTEPTNGHYHEFRMSKDLNGIIVGQTLWTFSLENDEYEMMSFALCSANSNLSLNSEGMNLTQTKMTKQHKHLIIARDVTAEMEGHTHEITVFKSMGIQGDAGSAKLGSATSLSLIGITKEGRTLSAVTLATLQEIRTALENTLRKITALIESADADIPPVITEAVDIILDADIWTALRAIQ